MSDSVPAGTTPDVWDSAGPSAPSPARMYDYYLGGKDNFRIDREAAEKAMAAAPVIPVLARANRAFLVEAVRAMAAAGVTQYLDIGSGLPTSPNVHEVARASVPDARVVYVDFDPVVVSHSLALRRSPGTAAVRADVRSPAAVFAAPEVEELIDLRQPCGLLLVSVLHFVSGNITPLVAEYTRRLAPGSYLALSHVVTDGAVASNVTGVAEAYEASPADPQVRSSAAVRELFTGFELQPPGLTDVRTFTDPRFSYSPADPAPGIWMLCALGRKL
ncbi:MAG TPA: SAM-dependent methyltransferase [Trebonia sp.]